MTAGRINQVSMPQSTPSKYDQDHQCKEQCLIGSLQLASTNIKL